MLVEDRISTSYREGERVSGFGVEIPQGVEDTRKGSADGWRKAYHSGIAREVE